MTIKYYADFDRIEIPTSTQMITLSYDRTDCPTCCGFEELGNFERYNGRGGNLIWPCLLHNLCDARSLWILTDRFIPQSRRHFDCINPLNFCSWVYTNFNHNNYVSVWGSDAMTRADTSRVRLIVLTLRINNPSRVRNVLEDKHEVVEQTNLNDSLNSPIAGYGMGLFNVRI